MGKKRLGQKGLSNTKSISNTMAIPLSDFKPLNLLYYETFLYFNKLPENLGTYEFSISFDFGKDPVNGREVKVPPAVIKAEFTDKDYVTLQ